MIRYERQQKIVEYLEVHKSATVCELSEAVYTSEASVRRDIQSLEAGGIVQKIYGGVLLTKYQNGVVPVDIRDGDHSAVKEELAKRAAKLIKDGDTVILDASSTVRRMVRYMGHLHNVRIITNNLRIFSECENPNIKLYCTGGAFSQGNHAFVGPSAENYIRGITADCLFFSSQGIDEEGIISDASEEETSLRRVMIQHSQRQYFLCDSSKLGVKKLFTLCQRDGITDVICDKPLPWH